MSLTRSNLLAAEPRVLGKDEGEVLHFLNHLAIIKTAAGDHGALSVVEFEGPRSMGPPLHRHEHEDEFFVIMNGEIVFHSDGEEFLGTAGETAFLPHGRAHTFQVRSSTARFIAITGSRTAAPGFDTMVAALGTPTEQATIPEPGPIDPAMVAQVCRDNGIEVLGPPLPLLDDEVGE